MKPTTPLPKRRDAVPATLLLAAAVLFGHAALAVEPDDAAPAPRRALESQRSDTGPAGASAVKRRGRPARGGDLWKRIRRGFTMPNLYNSVVLEAEASYAGSLPAMEATLKRSRRYLFYIVEELERRRMPTEIALLPMVESAFNPLAYSNARASGLWQFIPSTGKQYNLTQNWWFDARRDVVASTEAALDHLQALYRRHGDWHLALASYNWGERAVTRAIERNRKAGLKTDYWSLQLPDETRRYIPKLQALKNILRKPSRFGIKLPKIPNAPYFVTVVLTRDIDLQLAAELAEVPLDELVQLNPGHNRPVIEPSVAPHLILPASRVTRFLRNLENHDQPLSAWRTYTLAPGDNVERIAAAHSISASLLRRVNSLPRRIVLHPGDRLLVPAQTPALPAEFVPAALHPLLAAAERGRPRVARGVVPARTAQRGAAAPI
jgi:membrane-bound lytic murein transglycosylase D